MKTVDLLLAESGLTINDVAERANLTLARVEAIATGRWTPSPEERRRIAEALGVQVADVSWGHTMHALNIRYRQFGLKEYF